MITLAIVLTAIYVAMFIGCIAFLHSERTEHLAGLLNFMEESKKIYTLKRGACHYDVLAKSHSAFTDESFLVKRFCFSPDEPDGESFALLEAQELWEKLNEK